MQLLTRGVPILRASAQLARLDHRDRQASQEQSACEQNAQIAAAHDNVERLEAAGCRGGEVLGDDTARRRRRGRGRAHAQPCLVQLSQRRECAVTASAARCRLGRD
eukprot:4893692-Pleurochrysis_carterae.AAC.1